MIHGPECGYVTGKKNQYRRDIHAFVDRALGIHGQHHVPVSERRVLLLDESEGREVFFLLSKGYLPENLYVVNFSAAKMAVLQGHVRERTGHSVQTYGIDLARALTTRLSSQEFDVIHLDFTSNINANTLRLIHLASERLSVSGVLIANILKGREIKGSVHLISQVAETWDIPKGQGVNTWAYNRHELLMRCMAARDMCRVKEIFNAFSALKSDIHEGHFRTAGCARHSQNINIGGYRSGRVPMLWVAIQSSPHGDPVDAEIYIKALRTAINTGDITKNQLSVEAIVVASFYCLNTPHCIHECSNTTAMELAHNPNYPLPPNGDSIWRQPTSVM